MLHTLIVVGEACGNTGACRRCCSVYMLSKCSAGAFSSPKIPGPQKNMQGMEENMIHREHEVN